MSPSGSIILFLVSSATASGGDNVTFTCIAQGGPGNTFAWRHNMNAITPGGRFIIESTSSSSMLTVTNVIGGDFGAYICQVSNLAGSGSATSMITSMHLLIKNSTIIISYQHHPRDSQALVLLIM